MLGEKRRQSKIFTSQKDMEETILSMSLILKKKWGGEVKISNGDVWHIPVGPKKLPCEVEAKKTIYWRVITPSKHFVYYLLKKWYRLVLSL